MATVLYYINGYSQSDVAISYKPLPMRSKSKSSMPAASFKSNPHAPGQALFGISENVLRILVTIDSVDVLAQNPKIALGLRTGVGNDPGRL